MSYAYFLVRLSNPPVDSLKSFDSVERTEKLSFSIEYIKKKLIDIYPENTWDKWNWVTVNYKNKKKETLRSQILNLEGRFEVSICEHHFLYVNIDGSHHVDQVNDVKKIAESIEMSAFDVQTGERIYLQDT